jgi:hypothetical protein
MLVIKDWPRCAGAVYLAVGWAAAPSILSLTPRLGPNAIALTVVGVWFTHPRTVVETNRIGSCISFDAGPARSTL